MKTRYHVRGYASVQRRGRGVYLANAGEDLNGQESWDAFPTLAEAKRWCANFHERKRLFWEPLGRSGIFAEVRIPVDEEES